MSEISRAHLFGQPDSLACKAIEGAPVSVRGRHAVAGRQEDVLTVGQVLQAAQRTHRAGHLDEAGALYEAVLRVAPRHPDALHFLGVLRHQQGDSAAAERLIRQALDETPDLPGPWNNLGNVLLESGQADAAMQAYRHCLELAPAFADTLNNVGTLHRQRGEPAAAEACYRRAVAAQPDFADAWSNLARLLLGRGRVAEAVEHACRAVTLRPGGPQARKVLGLAYCMLGQPERAAEVYREWLNAEPDSAVAQHHLAACSGEQVPARASDAYVTQTFDAFADSFDAKLELLGYCAPQLLAEALAHRRSTSAGGAIGLDILDAGCGTGLCGPLLRPHARTLQGVDLSQRMLEHARRRRAYDGLHQAELGGFLRGRPGAFDAVVSADTLCYFGELPEVLDAARQALRAQGVLLFTVEALADDAGMPFTLQPHGRYAHARGYVRACLEQAGLQALSIDGATLRHEAGKPVEGWVVSACRACDGT